MFESDGLRLMLSAVAADPWCDTRRLALADLYQDVGDAVRESQCRTGPPPIGLVFCSGSGDGYGYGSGDGDGDGDGYGYGYGDGYGDGDGYGYGDGYGDGKLTLGGRAMPEADGGNWLLVLPHGWVICGTVVKQTGPYSFAVSNARVICRTGGIPWDELADGKRREGAVFRPWGDVNVGPQFVMSRRWVGDLPAC